MSDEKASPYRLAIADVVRTHDECLKGIAELMEGKTIMIEGRECALKTKQLKDEVFVDVLNPTKHISRLRCRIVLNGDMDIIEPSADDSDN